MWLDTSDTHDTSLSASKMEISGGNPLLIGRCHC